MVFTVSYLPRLLPFLLYGGNHGYRRCPYFPSKSAVKERNTMKAFLFLARYIHIRSMDHLETQLEAYLAQKALWGGDTSTETRIRSRNQCLGTICTLKSTWVLNLERFPWTWEYFCILNADFEIPWRYLCGVHFDLGKCLNRWDNKRKPYCLCNQEHFFGIQEYQEWSSTVSLSLV